MFFSSCFPPVDSSDPITRSSATHKPASITYYKSIDGKSSLNDKTPFLSISYMHIKGCKFREWYLQIDTNTSEIKRLSIEDENNDFPVIMNYLEDYLEIKATEEGPLLLRTNIGLYNVCTTMDAVMETTLRYLNFIHDVYVE